MIEWTMTTIVMDQQTMEQTRNTITTDHSMEWIVYDKPIPIYDDKKLYDDKPIYPSYVKDDRDKSTKDSKKSVSINKLKSININLNINGNNAGDINLGNKGARERYVDTYSSNGGGYGGGYDGHNKKNDKGFECIINNNNTNTNIVTGGGNITNGGGNATDGNVTDTCEECFLEALGPTNLTKLETYLAGLGPGLPHNLEEYCALIQSQIAIGISPQGLAVNINIVLTNAGISLTSTELADSCSLSL